MIDFSLPPDLVELKARVDRFIREAIVPLERDPRQGPHGPSEDFRRELVALGRAAGLLSPHAPVKWGGLGLDHRAMAVVFEAAGWSPLGPLALNIMAPDEGNTNLLDKIANDEQKERWLRPLGSRRDSHRILDDRARRRRRFGSQPDEDHGAPSRRRICHLGAQVANHRRSRREHQHRDGAHAR